MAKQRRPTLDDRAEAVRLTLTGLATGEDLGDLFLELSKLHPPHNTFPAEELLDLAADALEESGATRANPIDYEGFRERYLSEYEFRGRTDHRGSQYALGAAAMIRAGLRPDLLGEVVWWSNDDLWVFALYALVIYIRVAGERTGRPVGVVARAIAERRAIELDAGVS